MLIEIIQRFAETKTILALPLFLMTAFGITGHKIKENDQNLYNIAPGDNFPYGIMSKN
ncbi:MAG: hypothetical protein HQL12_01800 [Candidatus Omnitrophica bacterium]|nr:hypothetical protein [Candidatus Omnitrophota bacterium]